MVYFVGAGTGAVDLITVRGMNLLRQADVIIYAGSLVNPQLLEYRKQGCECYNSAGLTLDEVLEIMKQAEARKQVVVRLHTGDPSIYGAVREQMDELDKEGIAYESCPGVSACFGAAASLNLEYTLPGISQSLIITRMEGRTKVPEKERIESFAAHQTSMAIYLSAGRMEELGQRLLAGGYREETPAALVYKATWPQEEAYVCTVGTLYDTAKKYNITKTALVLVGDAVAQRNYEKSRLYAPDFSTEFRKAENQRVTASQRIHLSIISFTKKGMRLSQKIKDLCQEWDISLFTKWTGGTEERENPAAELVDKPVGLWTGERMRNRVPILFIGACGIAVRAAAPCLSDKLHDSPVLVMDEKGNYVIPVLSGHVGGANKLARELAKKTGAVPVITTATDINKVFAVDLFAKRNGLLIVNKEGIAKVSAKALAGKKITISIETGHVRENGYVPNNIQVLPYPPEGETDVVITSEEKTFHTALLLKPQEYVLGMGCRKGKEEEKIQGFIQEKLEQANLSISQVYALSSIRQKEQEPGFVEWCRKAGVLFLTYEAEELEFVEGSFHASSFVKDTVGVDNVCERAALKACGPGGALVEKKCARDGMTLAIGKREWRIEFDEE